MNLQVCQKDREPTVITINHREIIKEWAGALRLAEARGWKGLLDVLGCSSKEPALGVFLICLFQHWGSAVRWLFKSIHEYKSQMKLSSSVFSHFMRVNSPVLWPCELSVLVVDFQAGLCFAAFSCASPSHGPLPTLYNSYPSASTSEQQRDLLILMDLTPNTYPGLSSNLEIPKLKITLS